ncbi:hypothetical protein DFJ73DRAFT_768668 [Zopfochytrium polystomum]|nr:hypothetical protein DFJ73DRAFT_768668 [Zopfochytrium polystomum]
MKTGIFSLVVVLALHASMARCAPPPTNITDAAPTGTNITANDTMNDSPMQNPPATAIAANPQVSAPAPTASAEPPGSVDGAREAEAETSGYVPPPTDKTKKQQQKKQRTIIERQTYVKKEPVPVPQYVPAPKYVPVPKFVPVGGGKKNFKNVKIENEEFGGGGFF